MEVNTVQYFIPVTNRNHAFASAPNDVVLHLVFVTCSFKHLNVNPRDESCSFNSFEVIDSNQLCVQFAIDKWALKCETVLQPDPAHH